MILESIQFSNIYTIIDLQSKLDSGYFDEFLKEFAIYLMTEKGLVKVNKDKSIVYNVSTDLSNYITKVELNSKRYLTEHQSLEDYALKSELSNYITEDVLNSKGYLTTHQSLEGYVTETELNSKGYLTEHQSLAGYALKSDFNNLPTFEFNEDGNLLVTINGETKTFVAKDEGAVE